MKSDITHWMKNTLYNKFYKTENTNHKFEFQNSERMQFIIRFKKKDSRTECIFYNEYKDLLKRIKLVTKDSSVRYRISNTKIFVIGDK